MNLSKALRGTSLYTSQYFHYIILLKIDTFSQSILNSTKESR